jgi:23S rRNA pseudouridine2605 synthase
MISRRPQVENEAFSDNDMIKAPIKEEVRLNKFIANSGVCSRREADNFILAGVVTVNGEVVTELGTKVNIPQTTSASTERDSKERKRSTS